MYISIKDGIIWYSYSGGLPPTLESENNLKGASARGLPDPQPRLGGSRTPTSRARIAGLILGKPNGVQFRDINDASMVEIMAIMTDEGTLSQLS